MNRDEILAKSRSENAAGDERELQIKLKAIQIAHAVGILICALEMFLVSILSDDLTLVTYTCMLIYTGMKAVECWILALRLKKSQHWIMAILWTPIFIAYSVLFIRCLC